MQNNFKTEDYREKENKRDNDLNSYSESRIGSTFGNTTAFDDKQSRLDFNLKLNSNRLNSALDNKNVNENKKDDFCQINKKFSSEKRSFRYENNKGNLSKFYYNVHISFLIKMNN